MKVDAILLGASAGSFLAAVVLAERGLNPLIIEKSSLIGGGTAYSGGVVWAPNNHRMKAKGLSDSPSEALTYLEGISQGRWDPEVASAYVHEIPRVLAKIEQSTSLSWVTYSGLPDYYAELPGGKFNGRFLVPLGARESADLYAAVERHPEMALVRQSMHAPGQENEWIWGRALLAALWARVLELGVDYRTNQRAVRLLSGPEGVSGVDVSTPTGVVRYESRLGVLLNTGGFEWNKAMTEHFIAPPLPHPQTPPCNEGDGHAMALDLGAEMQLMDKSINTPSVKISGMENEIEELYRLIFQPLCLPHSIVVNQNGRRFANETFFVELTDGWKENLGSTELANLPSFLILDHQHVERFGIPQGLDVGPTVSEHPDLEELAKHYGIELAALREEISEFNRAVLNDEEDRFGRGRTAYQRAFGDPQSSPNPTTGTVEVAPFYAIRLYPSTSGHRGGVKIDDRARVLDTSSNQIRALYACGNAAAGTVTGDSYISGVTVGHALVFATLAAEEMISNA